MTIEQLTALLVGGSYRREHVALLFGLPEFEIETLLGPSRWIRTSDILAKAVAAGSYDSLSPSLISGGTATTFQSNTAPYVLPQLITGAGGEQYSAVQVGALFGINSAVVISILGAGPYSAQSVVQAALSYPSGFPFANVTPTTVAAFNAA